MNKQRYIVVTGASGGFGSITCDLLVSHGFMVIAVDLKPNTAKIHDQLISVQSDLTDQKSISSAVEVIQSKTDSVAGLVNIAGDFDHFPLVEAKEGQFERLMQINLFGHQELCRQLFPLIRKGNGRIVNLSSETALAQIPLNIYGLSKKLFDTWSKQLRLELALLDIKVITIRAGGHRTAIIQKSADLIGKIDKNSAYSGILEKSKDKALKIISKITHNPDDVANVIFKSITAQNPKLIYHVNVSPMFKLLSLIPEPIRSYILVRVIKS